MTDAKMISRNNAEALIPVEASNEILKNLPEQSKLLSMMRRLPNMSAKQKTLPIASSLPTAYFLNGDTDMKKTSNSEWDKLTLTAEEIAVIVPIPEAVFDDSSYDLWGEIKPQIQEAFGVAIDEAITFGTNKPSTWADAIVPTAISKGKTVAIGTGEDIAADIIGEDGVMSKVEEDGYQVTGFFSASNMEAKLRNLRDANNNLLYLPSLQGSNPSTLLGRTISYDKQNIFDTSKAMMIAGDFSKAVYSIRQDMTYKVLDQAVIQNTDGSIAYNLAQQDMVALRCVMRLGVQIAAPISQANKKKSNRYPFAILQPKASA